MENKFKNQKELEFFGKITASVSHELNNILSIINEYSGLLGDLMYACEQGKPIENEKISKISQNITEQIKRQKNVIKLLNRFAHRSDNDILNFEFYELLNDITRLTRRIALLKKVNLEIKLPTTPTNITNSPFIIQHIIYRILILSLKFCNSNDIILIKTAKESSYEIVYIEGPKFTEDHETKENLNFITNLVDSISGKIELNDVGENKNIIKVLIPISIMKINDM